MDLSSIEHGWDVVDAASELVGHVAAVDPTYLTVSTGFLGHTDRYIPVAAMARIEHNRVTLNATTAELETQGWETVPASGVDAQDDLTTGTQRVAGGTVTDTQDVTAGATTPVDQERLRVPVAEAQLNVGTRVVT
jgi:hypothetical protein